MFRYVLYNPRKKKMRKQVSLKVENDCFPFAYLLSCFIYRKEKKNK